MTQRITLTVSDELAKRLTWLADQYNCDVMELAHELIQDGASVCEDAINNEACEQIRMLVEMPAAGRA